MGCTCSAVASRPELEGALWTIRVGVLSVECHPVQHFSPAPELTPVLSPVRFLNPTLTSRGVPPSKPSRRGPPSTLPSRGVPPSKPSRPSRRGSPSTSSSSSPMPATCGSSPLQASRIAGLQKTFFCSRLLAPLHPPYLDSTLFFGCRGSPGSQPLRGGTVMVCLFPCLVLVCYLFYFGNGLVSPHVLLSFHSV